MLKVLSIIGTRPEAIKMAPVIKLLASRADEIDSIVCVTGQHQEMLQQALDVFSIVPDIDLDCMTCSQSLSLLTARLFERIGAVLQEVKPDWVVAQGDTTTVFVAAMSAYYCGAKFAHVEAGLRTDDLHHPFPEEVNRRFADAVSALCFAPTAHARDRLLKEGHSPEKVVLSGNTVVDALTEISSRPYCWESGPLAAVDRSKRLVLVTAHRRENFGRPFHSLCKALKRIAEECVHDGVQLIFPVHLNPEVNNPAHELLDGIKNLTLLGPLDYVSLIQLMKNSELILTDSGGIQEEAPSFRVPVLILRDKTERPEGVDAGLAQLVGMSSELIAASAISSLRNGLKQSINSSPNPYGDGKAAERIVDAILKRSHL